MKEFLIENWYVILTTIVVPIAWIIVRITPTKKDDVIMKIVSKIINLIPDRKKNGGKHND